MKKPDFLIIGAMKCGTSSLHDYLGKHPQIFTTTEKELHFFNNSNYNPNLEPYFRHFKSDKKISGCSPQGYTKQHLDEYKNVPKRLFKHLPKLKLIYLIRNPVDRIYSHFYEQLAGGYGSKLSINEALSNYEDNHLVKTSMYYFQISKFLAFFPIGQIKIVCLEDLKNNQTECLNAIHNFLGVSRVTDNNQIYDVLNATDNKKMLFKLNHFIPNILKKLYQGLISDRVRQKLNLYVFDRLIIKRNFKKKEIQTELLENIMLIFKKDYEKLTSIFNQRFDSIWP